MEIGKLLDIKNRRQWRSWLKRNHKKEREIWLVYYRKASGKPRIPYDDAVEEALCFGWIDSQAKNIDEESYAQRFSPRRRGSAPSELNKERIRRLVGQGKMTDAGLEAVKEHLRKAPAIPLFVLNALKKDEEVWKNFQKFPEYYRRIRIGWIADARASDRKRRLRYFIKMTKQNKKFGTVQ
jgi:uncharacterized protein YdeI (YjbR/CyaY-like superfamily)